jgi:hypothetical protein
MPRSRAAESEGEAVKLISLSPPDEQMLRTACVHESGHAIVAQVFGLSPACFITGPSAACCRYEKPRAAFEHACVAWAGALAEDIAGARYFKRTVPGFALNSDTIRRWATAMLLDGGLAQLSPSDQEGIGRYRQSQIESAEYAFTLLDARRDLLEWRAAKLADEARPRFANAIARGDAFKDGEDLLRMIAVMENKR